MKSTCLLFTSNPMYFLLLFLLFYYFFRDFSGENLNFFYFSKKIYFLKCSTFLARFPSILKSREDYFCCTFPLLLLKSMKKHEGWRRGERRRRRVVKVEAKGCK